MSDRPFVDGPELVPPAELLELRTHLVVAPRAETRRAHLDAIVAQVRDHRRTAWGRAASRATRGAAAVVVTLTVTTGLAAADVLPDSAQKVFTSVSDRFGGEDDQADTITTEPVDDGSLTTTETTETTEAEREAEATTTTSTSTSTTTTSTTAPAPVVTTTTASTTTTTAPPTTSTTAVPGPTDPESPPGVQEPVEGSTDPVDGPTDPGAEEPDPTTTTTTTTAPTGETSTSDTSVRATSDDGSGDETAQDGDPG